MVNVLFIANAENRAKVFLPIADQLVHMGNNVNFVSLDPILNGKASDVLRKSKHPFIELPHYEKINLFKMNRQDRFKTLVDMKSIIRSLIENIRPNVIVCGAAAYAEGVFVEQAKKMDIKTVLMQDGLRIESEKRLTEKVTESIVNALTSVVNEWTLAFKDAHYFFTPFATNRVDGILLFGSGIKEKLLKKGIINERLIVVGNPLYDSIAPLPVERLSEISEYFGIEKNTPVVLFAMQCFHRHLGLSLDDEIEIVKNLVDQFSELPYITFLIKLHPENDYEIYLERFNDWLPPMNINLVKDEFSSAELLSLSDAFMTVYSTMALEALVHEVPIITLDFTKVKYRLDLEPAGLSIRSAEELHEFLKTNSWHEILKKRVSDHRDEILEREVANLGFASEKAAEAIVRIALNK